MLIDHLHWHKILVDLWGFPSLLRWQALWCSFCVSLTSVTEHKQVFIHLVHVIVQWWWSPLQKTYTQKLLAGTNQVFLSTCWCACVRSKTPFVILFWHPAYCGCVLLCIVMHWLCIAIHWLTTVIWLKDCCLPSPEHTDMQLILKITEIDSSSVSRPSAAGPLQPAQQFSFYMT